MSIENNIRTAEFDPKVCTYWLFVIAFVMSITLVGIPFLLLWLPFGMLLTRRYLKSMSCVLTEKSIKVKKGILVVTEKTIPLEKITDMGMVQGPLMRHFGLYTLSVETAGQSTPGALVALTGIKDAAGFREAVLDQREAIAVGAPMPSSGEPKPDSTDSSTLLAEIRDSLFRIEKKLER